MSARCGTLTASMFQPGLERPLWSVLAVGAGLLPLEGLSVGHEQESQAVLRHGTFEYLEPRWEARNGERVVKGTKYAASLFFMSHAVTDWIDRRARWVNTWGATTP